VNRRRFLWISAAAAAGGAVIACAPSAPRVATKPTDAPEAPPKSAAVQSQPTGAALGVSQQATTPLPTAPRAFREAPQLALLVKSGALPPVDRRLPDNPRVVKPLEETGQYGGVWHRAFLGLTDHLSIGKLMEARLIKWDAPDSNSLRVVPNVVEKWEQSKDATEFTFYLRKGVKWSDGVEVTTDDVTFWWEDIQGNTDLVAAPNQLINQRVSGEWKPAKLTVVDKYTWKVTYEVPYPLLPIYIAKFGGGSSGMHQNVVFPAYMAPAHYLKQFLPKYAGKDKLDELARTSKLQSWVDLWGKGAQMDGPIGSYVFNADLPVLTAWMPEKVLPADPIRFVRNPYFWQVDEQGNQLPYIDSVELSLYENAEVFKLWIAQGKIDCQMRNVDSGAYTFFKENEAKGDYRVLNWRVASTYTYYPNLTTPDQGLADLFAKPEFREALNLAVNREEIAQVVHSGLAKARQYSPISGSPEYDMAMEQRWAQFNPQRANELLDGLGLKRGADGTRLRADGAPLEITIEHSSTPGAAINDMHELVRRAWTTIGVKTSVKGVDRSLYTEHYHSGDIEVGYWSWDRASANMADPGRWLGTQTDGPWAPKWGHWYDKAAWAKQEPPPDHWIRTIWSLWEKAQAEPDEAKRHALFMDIVAIHRDAPVAVGVVGENVAPMIAKNNFRNVKGGYIQDDTLRDYGVIDPPTFFIKR
jgi:peptide/nickel transport system substrate-binding protein